MEDGRSVYHQVKSLITVRKKHSALLSRGELEFIYVEKDTYPLAYLRYDENEKLLVVINPADREVSFPCEVIPGEPVWFVGEGTVSCNKGVFTIGGKTGVILEVE